MARPAFKGITTRSVVRPTFRLAKDPNSLSEVLIKDGTEDIAEMIQSSYQSSLDSILNRFLEDQIDPIEKELYFDEKKRDPDYDMPLSSDLTQEVMDIYGDYLDLIEDVRDMYGLPSTYTNDQVASYLDKNYNDYVSKMKGEKQNEPQIPQTQNASDSQIEESIDIPQN